MSNIEIRQDHGHYTMFINGKFYGNYDTFGEAIKDLEILEKEKEAVA